ncbi:MAG: NADPH-dependent assimilatory sulfite reductase hemoprotein subunit [Planctomycetaceae bacterium]|nr:MAG: NADPH-dependent assimilatory sulfite reductase hemoprotein subunit [Planctomycetaceae bacterium]
MSEEKKSHVETVKLESNYLRGTLGEELAVDTDSFTKDSTHVLKHYGTYQQDDRDTRAERRAQGLTGKAYSFMVRTRIPGGKLTSRQLLAQLDLADELGNTTLRITSRQGLQLHGILKTNLRETIRRINETQLSTLGACGDVNRNVMCCPAPYTQPIYRQVQVLADQLADHLAPRTPAYHELWLSDPDSGEKTLVGGGQPEEIEPIYGQHYLPRKFKIGIGFTFDNCVDIYTHDIGLLAVVRDDQLVGYNVLVGGGQGTTPAAAKTFPALGQRMAFVAPDRVVDVATAIVKVQRDFGNREDRKVARLKYLVHRWGLSRFKAKVEEYYGQPLADPEPEDVTGHNDHIGWDQQGDGHWFYGLNIENGRILDRDSMQLKSALREICTRLEPGIRLTAHQSLLLTDLQGEQRDEVEAILRRHHVKLSDQYSTVRRWSMACVAWPTCGLAITDSERVLPGVIDQLELELAKLGLEDEPFTVRMTGCPNGCARPYNSDVGLVGKARGRYTVFVGGRLLGNRLNFIYRELVPLEEIVPTLVPLLTYFKQDRMAGESFGDFCDRKGLEDLTAWANQA